jgi:SAM-dependent methyltransferase
MSSRSSLPSFLGSEARILDLGSGGRRLREGAISLDISYREDVDVVADATVLPFRDGSFDLIVCTAVLEHIKRPEAVVVEMHKCCKRGGMVYVEVPFLQGYHEAPDDYWRFTLRGLEEIFKPFERLEAGICCGPASALAMFLAMLPNALFTSPFLRKLGLCVSGWATFYLKYLDVFLVRLEGAHVVASAFYFLGKKS